MTDLAAHPALPGMMPNALLRYDVIDRLLPTGVDTVLEVGCGKGAVGVRLAARYAHYLAVELDPTSAALAAQRLTSYQNAEVLNGALEDLDSSRRFDLVCAFEVLEHLEHDASAVVEWAGRLRPGGWLMISVPANADRMGPWDEMVGHFRRYDPSSLTATLTAAGLSDVSTTMYGAPLGHVLEFVRNTIARRQGSTSDSPSAPSMAKRTASSGRQLQFDAPFVTAVARWGTAPFCQVQRHFRHSGTGLIGLGRMPA